MVKTVYTNGNDISFITYKNKQIGYNAERNRENTNVRILGEYFGRAKVPSQNPSVHTVDTIVNKEEQIKMIEKIKEKFACCSEGAIQVTFV